jgi:hypothetical protein
MMFTKMNGKQVFYTLDCVHILGSLCTLCGENTEAVGVKADYVDLKYLN